MCEYCRSVDREREEKEKYYFSIIQRSTSCTKMPIECVCCNVRMDPNSQRPFTGTAMRLFVSARTNTVLPESGWMRIACRISYRNWRYNTEFVNALERLEEESNEMIVDTGNKVRFLYSIYIYILIYLIILFAIMMRTSK
jgi:hypothetical protein